VKEGREGGREGREHEELFFVVDCLFVAPLEGRRRDEYGYSIRLGLV